MKKCSPIMRPWVFNPLAISLIGKLDELEVSAQSGPRQRLPSRAKQVFCFSRQVLGHGFDHDVDPGPRARRPSVA